MIAFVRVVLFFYPLCVTPVSSHGIMAQLTYLSDFTFVCPTEILAFNDALAQFKSLNTAVLSTGITY